MKYTQEEIFEELKKIKDSINCHCGCGLQTPHKLGVDGCYREIANGKYVPIPLKNNMYRVAGHDITERTLFSQRLYAKHGFFWSLPKDHSSTNSLPDET